MNAEQQVTILSHGVEEILPEGGLLERLQRCEGERRPLRVKQGFDPTAPDIHLGHTVALRKLREFQQKFNLLGHRLVRMHHGADAAQRPSMTSRRTATIATRRPGSFVLRLGRRMVRVEPPGAGSNARPRER